MSHTNDNIAHQQYHSKRVMEERLKQRCRSHIDDNIAFSNRILALSQQEERHPFKRAMNERLKQRCRSCRAQNMNFPQPQQDTKGFAISDVYISMIYLAYLLIGLGILQAIAISGVPHLVGKVGAILLAIIAAINIKDYFWPGKWFTLKLPGKVKK